MNTSSANLYLQLRNDVQNLQHKKDYTYNSHQHPNHSNEHKLGSLRPLQSPMTTSSTNKHFYQENDYPTLHQANATPPSLQRVH